MVSARSSRGHLTPRAVLHSHDSGRGVALEGLVSLTAGLTVGFGLFGLINSLKLQDPERLPVVSYNLALSLVFFVLWLCLIQRRIDRRWAEALIAGSLLLAVSNVLLTFLLVAEPLRNNLVAILIIGAGCFLISIRWLAATLCIMLAAWAPVAWHVASSADELSQFGLTLLAATVLAVAVHSGRHRTTRRLRRSEDRYRRLFQQSKDAVAISTPEGRLLDINQAGLELFGYTGEEKEIDIANIARESYVDPKDRERLVAKLLDEGFVQDHESTLKTQSGEILNIEGTTSIIQDDSGKAVAFLAILRNITTRKRELEELARHRERLEELVSERTARLEEEMVERKREQQEHLKLERQFYEAQKLESLGVLAGGIAHDFNNLLVGMMGNSSLIRRELPTDSPHLSKLEQIEIAAQRAAELANQMLAYAGQAQFLFEDCDLGRMVKEVANLLRTSISKMATLDLDLADDLLAIRADITQIRQVVMNLIINASDALSGDRGTITVRTRIVNVDRETTPLDTTRSSALSRGRYVGLEVADTGCGMDEATRSKIFDPFFSTKFDGHGLGLAAVLGIVRSHRASIEVESTPGRGSTFRVLFPASHERAATVAEPEPEPTAMSKASGTILLADDEEVVRQVSRAVLEKAGLEVLVAKDGLEALEIFEQHADKIDLVMLDSRMPHMDGAQTFHELRRLRPDVEVILCSGDPEGKATRGLDGLADFVKKPYQPPRLLQKVLAVLEPSSHAAAPGRDDH